MKSKKRTYGTGSVYKNRDKWVVKWYQDSKPTYLYGFLTKIEALKALKTKNNQNFELTIENYYQNWLEKRKITNKSWQDDDYRWSKHLSHLNDRLPSTLTVLDIKSLVENKLQEGLSPSTIRLIIKLLSSFLNSLLEMGIISNNIIQELPKSVKRLYRPVYNWASTPFISSLNSVDKILGIMTGDLRLAYALGVYGGLRPGEILGLKCEDIDLINRRIIIKRQLKNGVITTLKDKEHRVIPVVDKLLPYLNQSVGFIINGYNKYGLRKGLKGVLKKLRLPIINWYQSTRHTFASHYIMNGGSIEKLSKILGHSSIKVTERYSHLSPEVFNNDYKLFS